nr:zinc finger, CCHC-type [Tanacetum cinerariifolium]
MHHLKEVDAKKTNANIRKLINVLRNSNSASEVARDIGSATNHYTKSAFAEGDHIGVSSLASRFSKVSTAATTSFGESLLSNPSSENVINVEEATCDTPIVNFVDVNAKPTSYAGAAGAITFDQLKSQSNFRPLVAEKVFDGVNISVPQKVVEKINSDADFKESITIGIPDLDGPGFIKAPSTGSNGSGTRSEASSKAGSSTYSSKEASLAKKGTPNDRQKDKDVVDTGVIKIYYISTPNLFAALGEDEKEEVENVWDEYENLNLQNTWASTPTHTVNIHIDNKTLFCSFVYADNYYVNQRTLWNNLAGHSSLMKDKYWVFGDFNAALNLEDNSRGGYEPNTAMCEFEDCVQNMKDNSCGGYEPYIESEGKLAHLEQPLIPIPLPVAPQVVRDTYKVLYDVQYEVACLMLRSVSFDLHRVLENYKAYDLIQELKTMFEEQAKQELFDTVKAFHACKQEHGQSLRAYILKMNGYLDTLERLRYVMPKELGVSLILKSLNKDYDQFVQNYNMHSMGKSIVELHAMLKLYEKGIPKKAETPVVLAIHEENQHVNRYIQGLAPEIKANVTLSRPATILSVVSMANRLTTDGIKDGIFKKENAGNQKSSIRVSQNPTTNSDETRVSEIINTNIKDHIPAKGDPFRVSPYDGIATSILNINSISFGESLTVNPSSMAESGVTRLFGSNYPDPFSTLYIGMDTSHFPKGDGFNVVTQAGKLVHVLSSMDDGSSQVHKEANTINIKDYVVHSVDINTKPTS